MQEAAFLHLKWNEYVVLFGTGPERVDLLNRAAPGFFHLVQDSWWDDLLLHISRMTDDRNDERVPERCSAREMKLFRASQNALGRKHER